MSHQSGITADAELLNFFPTCKDGQYRLIQIKVDKEQLVLVKHATPQGDWEAEYNQSILPLLEDTQPCYILYRLDSTNRLGYEWLFLTWIPNNAHVRDKMLYASTRATLKKVFGDACIKEEILGHHQSDINLKGYESHLVSKKAPKPLTAAEEEMEDVRKNEMRQTGLNSGQQTISGTEFQPTAEAMDALQNFATGNVDYVQLKLDTEAEIVVLSQSVPSLPAEKLQSYISQEEPLYHLYRFRHNYEGDSLAPTLFFYTFVGYKVSVKQRMLYSSCKAPLISRIEYTLKSKLDKKLELDATDSLTQSFLLDTFHPQIATDLAVMSKPKAPGRRGKMPMLDRD